MAVKIKKKKDSSGGKEGKVGKGKREKGQRGLVTFDRPPVNDRPYRGRDSNEIFKRLTYVRLFFPFFFVFKNDMAAVFSEFKRVSV